MTILQTLMGVIEQKHASSTLILDCDFNDSEFIDKAGNYEFEGYGRHTEPDVNNHEWYKITNELEFEDYHYDCNPDYTIPTIDDSVVAEETFDFEAPYVYVKNSNYRDHFFLSAEVDNYDPAGYEILWDNGERTKSIACEFGEYHEVTVTNRAGSTTEWNVAGVGDVREYNYLADIGIVSIPLTETGTIINAANYYNITNNTDYSENCSIQYYANVDSVIANDLGTAYINKKSDTVSSLRENG